MGKRKDTSESLAVLQNIQKNLEICKTGILFFCISFILVRRIHSLTPRETLYWYHDILMRRARRFLSD